MFLTSRKYRRLAALISFAVFILVYRYLQHAAHGPAFSVASVVPRLGQEKPAPSASFAAKLSPPNKVAHIQYDESDDDSNANVVDSDSEEALVRADNLGNHIHQNPNQQKKPSHLSNSDSSSGGSILGRLSSESNLSRPFHIGPILQNSGAIPRLILHIHSTADREQIQYEVQSGLDHKDRYNWFKSWESVNPTHIQILFDDKKDSLRLIKGSYGWEVSSTYYKLPYVRQRREYTQFLMLRHFGGVFADMRTKCTTPVDKWDLGRKRIRFIVGLDTVNEDERIRFSIRTVASVPRHPLLDAFLTSATVKILKMDDSIMNVIPDLIPDLFSSHLIEYLQKITSSETVETDIKSLSATGHLVFKDILILGSAHFDPGSKTTLAVYTNDHINRLNQRNPDVKLNDIVSVADDIGIFRPTAKDTKEFLGIIMPYQILRTWDTKRRVEIKAASQNGTSHITRDRWKWFKSWESQNKGHQHLIFDVEDRDRLVRGTFSKVVEETYFKLPVASRPLFARFLLLYVFGGIYADMDTSCHTMFDMWLEGMKGVDVVVGLENEDRISSHVVGAMPGHRFIAKVIEGIVQLLHDKSEKELASDETLDDVLKHGMLTHVVKTYILKQLAASDPWKQISEMQSSNIVIDGFMILGKAHFKPAPYFLLHHLTGFGKDGWRNQNPAFDIKSIEPADNSTMPKVELPSEHFRNPQGIPKYILRTHITSDRRSILNDSVSGVDHQDRHNWMLSWDSQNTNYTTIILSEEDADRFVRGIYGGKVADAYFRLGLVSQRRQLIKYLMLYHFGGIYVDMDVSCESEIDVWIRREGVEIVVGVLEDSKAIRFVPYTLASIPRHELMDRVIQQITAVVLGKKGAELDADPNLVDNIWNDILLKQLTIVTRRATASLRKFKIGHVTYGSILVHGASHFQQDGNNAVFSVQHEDVFLRSNLIAPTNIIRETPKVFDVSITPLDIYRPKPKNIATSDGIFVPNQVLRTYKTSNRLEIQEGSANKTFDERQWAWFTSWDEMNPNHYQLIWNDDDSDRFVRGTFNDKIVEAYFRLPFVVLRADLTRYLMLYAFGGVYTDMDTSCHVPIEKWFYGQRGVNVVFGVEHNFVDKDSTNQWTIVSAPRHEFMHLLIKRVVTIILESSLEYLKERENILDITGPGISKKVVWEYLKDVKKVDLKEISNLHHGFKLFDDFMILGRAHMNALPLYVQHHEDTDHADDTSITVNI